MTDFNYWTTLIQEAQAAREELDKRKLQHLKELLQKFDEHMATVPEEYREAVVEDFLDQSVKHGWIDKEFRNTLVYNKDYKGNKQ